MYSLITRIEIRDRFSTESKEISKGRDKQRKKAATEERRSKANNTSGSRNDGIKCY